MSVRPIKTHKALAGLLPAGSGIFKLSPWLAFFLALITYWLSVDSGASYWDCPEYLLSAIRLEVGHAPGNPGWMLAHRFVSSFFSDPTLQVRVINMMAGLFTGLAVMILCSISISVMRWVWPRRGSDAWRNISISVASLSGSLCFAWSDSAWFSAVEAEVYAMSLFLSSITIWMAVKWAFSLSRSARARWTVALMFVIGFSLGVHQLNLLALPAIALIMLFRSRRRCGVVKGMAVFSSGCVLVGFILLLFVPGAIWLAGKADILAVNGFGCPYWSGVLALWCLTIAIVVALAILAARYMGGLSTVLWSMAALMVGLSVYIVIPVRAWANPPVNEGNPSDIFRFSDYFHRRQYGSAPLFYGRTPYSKIMRIERVSVNAFGDTLRDYSWNALRPLEPNMRPMVKNAKIPSSSRFLTDDDRALNDRFASADSCPMGYVVTGYRSEPVYTPQLNMWFPRIYSSDPEDIIAYRDWTGMDSSNMVSVPVFDAVDSLGHTVPMRASDGSYENKIALRPTYIQSAIYLTVYQIGYMYLRYLMWNYSGRQNDVPSTGEIDHGNFITGFPPVDDFMLGPQSSLPPELGSDNEGRNVYFAIPFILGVIGLVWLFYGVRRPSLSIRMRRVAWASLVLFLMTGVAIVFYLNQSPGEPRERDYSFLGSFWTFALWIAFGMLALLRCPKRRWVRRVALIAVCSVPCWMLAENWSDHNRSNRSATLDFASNLLESLDEDAILFVDGDNYIFPLWFAQEVMGVRLDVSVICGAYLNCDWYVRQLMIPGYVSDPLPMMASEGDMALGFLNNVHINAMMPDTVPAAEALKELYAQSGPAPSLKHRWLLLDEKSDAPWVFDVLSIRGLGGGSVLSLRELATLDIVASNSAAKYPRPVYWQQNSPKSKYSGFYPFTRQALFTRKLMPQIPDSVILVDEALDAIPLLRWGGLDQAQYPGVDVVSHAAAQRASLIRLAQSLADVGRHDQALHVARAAAVRFPASVVPFSIRFHADSAFYEARQLASVLRRSGIALGDTAVVSQARDIEKTDSIRTEAFRRYRMSVPAWRRPAISPDSRNHTIK